MTVSPIPKAEKKPWKIAFVLATVKYAIIFSLGFFVGNIAVKKALQDSGLDLGMFLEVKQKIDQGYINPSKLDSKKLSYGAIAGWVKGIGDKYTYFLPPEISKLYLNNMNGTYIGIGIMIEKNDELLTVMSVFHDSQASKAGILEGDVVMKVGDKEVDNLTVEEVATLIRGAEGTPVTLTIIRKGKKVPLVRTITRKQLNKEVFRWKLINKTVAYIKLDSFSHEMIGEFNRVALEIKNSGARQIILDERYNLGGYLNEAISFTGWFLEDNSPITVIQNRTGKHKPLRCKMHNPSLKDLPMVVLVNKYSASASEVVASAVRSNRNVPLVGETTYGKGVAMTQYTLSDGSILVLTDSYWFTPDGISISEKGIEPDVTVLIKAEDIESGKFRIGEPGKDAQLDKALEILSNSSSGK